MMKTTKKPTNLKTNPSNMKKKESKMTKTTNKPPALKTNPSKMKKRESKKKPEELTDRMKKRIDWWQKKDKVAAEKRSTVTFRKLDLSTGGFKSRLLGQAEEDNSPDSAKPDISNSNESDPESPEDTVSTISTRLKTRKEDSSKVQGDTQSEKNSKTKEKIISKKKSKRYILFVGNIPYETKEQDLFKHFQKTNGVLSVRIPTDIKTNRPRGFAYVDFKDTASHRLALQYHKTEFKGRRLNVEFTSRGKGSDKERMEMLKEKNIRLDRWKTIGLTENYSGGEKKRNPKRSGGQETESDGPGKSKKDRKGYEERHLDALWESG